MAPKALNQEVLNKSSYLSDLPPPTAAMPYHLKQKSQLIPNWEVVNA